MPEIPFLVEIAISETYFKFWPLKFRLGMNYPRGWIVLGRVVRGRIVRGRIVRGRIVRRRIVRGWIVHGDELSWNKLSGDELGSFLQRQELQVWIRIASKNHFHIWVPNLTRWRHSPCVTTTEPSCRTNVAVTSLPLSHNVRLKQEFQQLQGFQQFSWFLQAHLITAKST
jgi:hypothetical protein